MKHTTRKVIGALLITGIPLTVTTAFAQAVETIETTTTTEGTISEFGPQLLVIKNETAGEPLRYTYSKTTTYVDEAGQPVAVTTVKSGLPVTVYYTRVGDTLVASKVIVRKAVSAPTVRVAPAISATAGTISEFSPGGIILTPDPVHYTYTRTTTYVDEAGRPVSVNSVKPGQPVTVHYTGTGDAMVASKVIVRNLTASIPRTSETILRATTSAGTVSEFGADRILIRTEASPEPVSYSYSKTTTYVDEAGQPVAVTTVKSGLPVTLHYTKVGDTLMVSKVIVRKAAVVPPPVVETKKTTTTTTTDKK